MNRMEQLLAFCDWERKHNPNLQGRQHIAEWAAQEIERLSVENAKLKAEQAGAQPVAQEPIAEVCAGWTLRWVGAEPIATLLDRHQGVRIGSMLYTAPPAPRALTGEEVDRHLDSILRASGSALKHYTMDLTLQRMRAAMRGAILAAAGAPEPAQPVTTPNLR